MKRYLVTGGAGFIGANFVKYVLDKYGSDVEILILDSLTYAGNLLTLRDETARDNVTFVRGDICDRELVKSLLDEFDPNFIVNFAAESHVDRSIANPRLFLETNILGTQNLLECARQCWSTPDGYKPDRLFLQISTDEVYGSLERECDTAMELELNDNLKRVVENRPHPTTFGSRHFTELSGLAPRSPYSASKTSADLLVLAYHETYGMPVVITRCSNNYGPYQFPEKLIPLVINNILSNKPIPVYGQGLNVRDWLYVADHAKAIDLVLRKGRVGEVYNVGGLNEEQNITIVKTIIDIVKELLQENPEYSKLAASPEAIGYDMITFVTDRPGHDMRYAIDPTKIATELGWYPETTFRDGIRKTVKWYLDNNAWVESVTSGEYLKYYEQMYGNR